MKRPSRPGLSLRHKAVLIGVGLIVFWLILEAGLRLAGFIVMSVRDYRNALSVRQKGSYRILCLGESTTQNQWPPFLQEVLNGKSNGIRFSVIDKGMIKTTTSAIVSRLESYLDEFHPDMVVAMIGINDLAVHMPYDKPADSKVILFLRSLRTYQLARLLGLHMATRAGELGLFTRQQTDQRALAQEHLAIRAPDVDSAEAVFLKAENALRQKLESDPRNDAAYVELGQLYRCRGRFDDAQQCYEKALGLNPGNAWGYFGLGWVYRDQKQFLRAEQYFKKALELDPRNDIGYVWLAQLYRIMGRHGEAEQCYMKALALNPKNAWCYVGLGWVLHDQKDLLQAAGYFSKARELDPRNVDALIGLAQIYRDTGQLQQAETCYRKVMELDPGNDGAYLGLGWLFHVNGQLEQAERHLNAAVELNPRNDGAYYELGWLFHDRGEFSEAERYFMKAIELNPLSYVSYIQLGWLYHNQASYFWGIQSFDQAEEYYNRAEASVKKALEINPSSDWAYVELGWQYRGRERLQEAEECYKKALEVNPMSDAAYSGLGQLYFDQRQFPKAEEYFKKALDMKVNNQQQFYGALGTIYEETDQNAPAKEYLRNARQLRAGTYNPVTANNYKRIKDILDKRNVKLVCVQYPMRDIGPLRAIFEGNSAGLLFVDNEKVFKDAVKKDGFRAYFKDMFGGDFGHCTDKGNRLLAENIAGVILNNIIHK